ncbi:MAG: M1 family metallopeptidase [Bacteroidales bacterium]
MREAIESGTRTRTGKPGPAYWQNRADYNLIVKIDPETGFLNGEGVIELSNNSPDTLEDIVFQIPSDIYLPGSQRDIPVSSVSEEQSIEITGMRIDGQKVNLSDERDYFIAIPGIRWVKLRSPLSPIAPETNVKIELSWRLRIANALTYRTGWVDSSLMIVSWFYPRIAVYDDLSGWDFIPHQGNSEFYQEPGDFDLEIILPQQWLAFATGRWLNPGRCLSAKYAARYRQMLQNNEAVEIISVEDLPYHDFTPPDPEIDWRFHAADVPGVFLAISNGICWKADRLAKPGQPSDTLLLQLIYKKESRFMNRMLEPAKRILEVAAGTFPGLPYPWPGLTLIESPAAMEFPMAATFPDREEMPQTIVAAIHEILNSWIPFWLGTNEKNDAWMDEGFATAGEVILLDAFSPQLLNKGYTIIESSEPWPEIASLPAGTPGWMLEEPAYSELAYEKAGLFFLMLRETLGEEETGKLLKSFFSDWSLKHPSATDFFYAVEATGADPGWLINRWFYQLHYVDFEPVKVDRDKNGYSLKIVNHGGLPYPAGVKVLYPDGEHINVRVPVTAWKEGDTTYVRLPVQATPVQIETFTDYPIDLFPGNNILRLATE